MEIIFKKRNRNAVHMLFYCFKKVPQWTLLLVIVKIAQSLSPVLLLTSITNLINHLTIYFENGGDLSRIITAFILISISQLVTFVGPSLYRLINTKIVLVLSQNIELTIFDWIGNINYADFENIKNQDLIYRIKESCMKNFVAGVNNILAITETIIKLVSIILVLIIQAKLFTFLILFLCIPMLWASYKSGKDTYSAIKESQEAKRMSSYYDKLLSDREFSQERSIFSYYEHINENWKLSNDISIKAERNALKKNWFRIGASSCFTLLGCAVLAAILLIPLYQGNLSYGFFAGILSSSYILFEDIIYNLSWDIEQFVETKEFLLDLHNFFCLNQIETEEKHLSVDNLEFRKLQFKQVSFRYPETENYILKDLSFEINKGKNYAFVGKNGAGKSTITKLILGLYSNYEGQILLNGIDIKKFNTEERSKIFSVVFQDFARYNLSIVDNIKFGDSRYSEESINHILQEVGLKEYISSLPEKEYSVLGKILETDTDLSGGQWQRIAIARALILNNPFSILDEPTSSIDPASEQELYELFSKVSSNRTGLFITHRLGSIKMADKIYVMENGTIAESGDHQELILQEGIYYNMFEIQKEWYN